MATQKAKQFQELFSKAKAAGLEAGEKADVAPMVVQDADLFGKAIPGGNSYYVADGVCGFAWVKVRPGNSSFARYLVKVKLARPAYDGGVDIWIHEFNQSMQRKEAAAYAMARVLSEAGIQAYAGSRMD